MRWYGDEAEQLYRTAFVAGGKVDGMPGNSQGHSHLINRRGASVGKGHVVQNSAVERFPFQHRLQKTKAVFDHPFAMQKVHQFLDRANFGAGLQVGHQEVGGG